MHGERHNKDQEPNVSIVPAAAGTDISFGINSQHFVLGYFHRVPSRTNPLHILPKSDVDGDGLKAGLRSYGPSGRQAEVTFRKSLFTRFRANK